ncbi:RNA polymerase III RPC4-domain-containing protein [Stachybotrys elegans]|uniref:RNA polymerase III RPC4-domain-containing protein n=1 Tax=Stachybotrys elegans TaxID=80388 RepID=A0A8K0SV84_9HYPO|nr:RNA polymerase III RPC4-domain-containing protein [Stachybotrys elegans]
MVRGRTPARGTGRAGAAVGRRQPAASATPAPSPASASASESVPQSSPSTVARGGTTARATRGTTAGRFRPKNVRRDEAERDNLARQEEQKANERAAEERRAQGRSRFRSKRSRGDAMGSRGRIISGASGPFSGGTAGSGGFKFGGGSGFGGFGGGGGGGGFRGRDSKTPGFSQSDNARLREPRINADKLHNMTPEEELDDDDELMMNVLSNKKHNSLPMGIYRREHKETEVVVATTAELEAAENAGEEESLWVDGDDSRPVIPQPAEEGVWGTESKSSVLIKKEPEADDAMDIDSALQSVAEATPATQVAEQKPKKPLPLEPEDKEILTDMELLANELGAVTVTEDGETKTDGPANKDGRMYLFQFPPLMPPLHQTTAAKPPKVKAEPQQDVSMDAPQRTGESSRIDLTEGNDDNDDDEAHPGQAGDELGFMSDMLSQGGLIGRLVVRKSGKVEMDWGGTTLEMNPATSMGFETTAVILEEKEEKPQAGVIGGESIGMGKIMGRFVLAPVWGEDEDWDVDPAELAVE